MRNKRKRVELLNVILPLLFGGIYYYLFCPDVAIIKKLDSLLGCAYHLQPLKFAIFSYIRFYLLDALWAYALFNSLYMILGNNSNALVLCTVISLTVSLIMELFQMLGIAMGTFDICDIVIEFVAILIALVIIKMKKEI